MHVEEVPLDPAKNMIKYVFCIILTVLYCCHYLTEIQISLVMYFFGFQTDSKCNTALSGSTGQQFHVIMSAVCPVYMPLITQKNIQVKQIIT